MRDRHVALPFAILATAVLAACAASAPPANRVTREGEPSTSPVYQAMSEADAALSKAFNAHDLDGLMSLFADDLEFYHDTGGLQRYADVQQGFGKLFAKNDRIRRELLPGTFRVYPIAGYGAVELGAHRFCHAENGRDECGTFEFVHVWRHEANQWKLARAVSYGHRPPG